MILLVPGPLVFIRYLLLVPVWPMMLKYSGVVSRSTLEDDFPGWSGYNTWLSPLDWFDVEGIPSLTRYSIPETFVVAEVLGESTTLQASWWIFVATFLWTFLEVLVALFFILKTCCAWYLNMNPRGDSQAPPSWGDNLTDSQSTFHRCSARVQGILGMGLTRMLSRFYWGPPVWILFVLLLIFASRSISGDLVCTEKEWIFIYSHIAWLLIVHVGYYSRWYNIFLCGTHECRRYRF